MYDLPDYKEHDQELIFDFIAKNPFAFLMGCDSNNSPVATQVPVFLENEDGKLFIRGHIMKNTDHHKAFEKNENALVVFTGAHTYVSATWYTNPHQGSTWNYMSVHVRGKMTFLGDQQLAEVLQKTSLHFEKGNRQAATVFENLPHDYTSRLMKAIVAFQVEVTSIENVFKLSQNRDKESYQNIQAELRKQGNEASVIADEMEKRTEQVFPQKG